MQTADHRDATNMAYVVKSLAESEVCLKDVHHPEVRYDIETFLRNKVRLGNSIIDSMFDEVVGRAARYREVTQWSS